MTCSNLKEERYTIKKRAATPGDFQVQAAESLQSTKRLMFLSKSANSNMPVKRQTLVIGEKL